MLSSCIEETPRIPETPPSVPWMLEPRPPHTAQDAGLQLQKGSTDYHGQSHNTFFWVGDPVPVSGKGHRSSSSSLFRVRSRNGSVMTSFPRTVCLSICFASSPWLGTDDSPVLALRSGNTEFLREPMCSIKALSWLAMSVVASRHSQWGREWSQGRTCSTQY